MKRGRPQKDFFEDEDDDDGSDSEGPVEMASHKRSKGMTGDQRARRRIELDDEVDSGEEVEEEGEEEDEDVSGAEDGSGESGEDEDDEESEDEDEEEMREPTETDLRRMLRKEAKGVAFGKLLEMEEELEASLKGGDAREKREKQRDERRRKRREMEKNRPKRENKNRPMEVSSKRPVNDVREVITLQKKEFRDPRFDPLGGSFNEESFKKSYSFLNGIIEKEIGELRKKLKKTKNEAIRRDIQRQLSKLSYFGSVPEIVFLYICTWLTYYYIQLSKRGEERRAELEKKIKREWRKKEVESVEQGKKPFHLRRSMLRSMIKDERSKQLKKKGKLTARTEQKEKRTQRSDERRIPQTRRER